MHCFVKRYDRLVSSLPKKDGYFYALKGIYHEDEVQELDKKFEVKDVITLHVPELVGERHLIVLR